MAESEATLAMKKRDNGDALDNGGSSSTSLLAAGSSGVVYENGDGIVEKHISFVQNIRRAEDVDERRERFQREAAVLQVATRSGVFPELVSYEATASEGILRMKKVAGETVMERIARGYRFTDNEVLSMLDRVLTGLHVDLHPRGYVHRDLSPNNILVNGQNDSLEVRVVDFGSVGVDATGTISGTVAAGTLGYCPREQWEGNAIVASDIYALGATAYSMLTGDILKTPYDQFNFDKVRDRSMRKLLKKMTAPLEAGLFQTKRYKGAKEALDDVEEILGKEKSAEAIKNGDVSITTTEEIEVPLEQLDTIRDSLAAGYKRLKKGTMRTSAQLQKERLTNKGLRSFSGYTANCAMYEMQDGEAYVHFLAGDNNFFFKNIDEVCEQLIATGNYVVPAGEVEPARRAAKSFKLSDLGLIKHNDELSYFEINTKKYDKLNPVQRQFAEAVHGEGKDFKNVMEMLNNNGKNTTRVYVLNPQYVQNYFKNHPVEKAVARACWLNNFDSSSSFSASYRVVDFHNGLRGVPLVSAEGGRAVEGDKTIYNLPIGPIEDIKKLPKDYNNFEKSSSQHLRKALPPC